MATDVDQHCNRAVKWCRVGTVRPCGRSQAAHDGCPLTVSSASPDRTLWQNPQIHQAKRNLPKFALAASDGLNRSLWITAVIVCWLCQHVAVAQDDPFQDQPNRLAPIPPALQPTSALLWRSAQQLRSYESVTARVRQQIRMFEQNLVAVGSYEQVNVAPDYLFRLQLAVSVGQGQNTILQVSDGRFLWTNRTSPAGQTSIQRVDLNAARRASVEIGQSTDVAASSSVLGGLPQLMESLAANYTFSQPRAAQLHSVPVWMVSGQLSERAARQFRDESASLLKHLPSLVTVALGREDLFPFRIEYRAIDPEQPAKDVAQARGTPVLVTEWFEVQYDVPVDPQRFIFRPGEIQVEDKTAAYVASLKSAG